MRTGFRSSRMSTRYALRNALALALELPSGPHHGKMTLAHLRLLCRVAALAPVVRSRLVDNENAKKPAIEKRIMLLRRWHLIVITEGAAYRNRQMYFTVSTEGERLVAAFRGGRNVSRLVEDLCVACDRTREPRRDNVASVAHLELLRLIANEGERTITSLLPYFSHEKQTLRSRLQYLANRGLVDRDRINLGGNGWANHYDATESGRALLRLVVPH